jgi:uroporphyrinogen-III synthase
MRILSIHTLKEAPRAKYLGNLSNRNIETLAIASKSAVSNFTSAFKKSGLEIHQALAMEEEQLLACLFPNMKRYHSPIN